MPPAPMIPPWMVVVPRLQTSPVAAKPPRPVKLEKPEPPPEPQMSDAPAVRVALTLDAPYAAREDGQLTLDKRVFIVRIEVKDEADALTSQPVPLQARLFYEDLEELPPEVQATALVGNVALRTAHGNATFKLRCNAVSSQHDRRRFRVRIAPQDPEQARRHPRLIQDTEPFTMVSKTNDKAALPKAPKLQGVGAIGGGPVGSKRPLDQGAVSSLLGADATGVADSSLPRRRYFPADAIRDTLAPTPGCADGALLRSAVAGCDRLAALVVQQLTQRSMQHARRQRPGTGDLRMSDVAAVVKAGQYDILHEAGVTKGWLTEPVSGTAPAPATAPALASAFTPALAPSSAPTPSPVEPELIKSDAIDHTLEQPSVPVTMMALTSGSPSAATLAVIDAPDVVLPVISDGTMGNAGDGPVVVDPQSGLS
jgi:hypothetical protein